MYPTEKATADIFTQYVNTLKMRYSTSYNIREVMLQVDKDYSRQTDLTSENLAAKKANRMGDTNKFRNITVPIIATQVESSTTYQTSVFLTGQPIFGVVSSPKYIDQAKQLETIIDNQATRGAWARHLTMFFRDGHKYNMSALEVYWKRELLETPETDITTVENAAKTTKIAWEGNCIKRLDLYNTFWDTRFSVADVPEKGEYAGYSELITKAELKKLFQTEPNALKKTVQDAFNSTFPSVSSASSSVTFYIPQISQTQMISPLTVANGDTDWEAWANGSTAKDKKIDYKNTYLKTVAYIRIIPSIFNLTVSEENTPQIWRIVTINNSVAVVFERLNTYKDTLPILFGQPYEDGLSYQTQSLAQNGADFQAVTTALLNSTVHARRRAISDRVLFDPSRVSADNINSENPSAKIPIRPAAYGKPLSEAVYAFPFRDDQAGIISGEISSLINMANDLAGQNKPIQGQFQKGNKTQKEFDSVMANARGKDQMISILLESQVFTPLKEILKHNILLYQTPATLYSRSLKDSVNIDPIQLRKASLQFKLSDGLIPTEKIISAEAFTTALQVLGSSPAIAQEYNIGKLFSFLMKTQGADLEEFEKTKEQVEYERALNSWQNAMNNFVDLANKGKFDVSKMNLPPQPVPEQFGYLVKDSSEPKKTDSILSQITYKLGQEAT